ncbi:MAG: aminoacyl-tRNA hydrolase [Actinobacteria bacterium]|nr:aminoacyl-tRNA hydrolase [Actinomycetota bacterium]
MSPDEDLRAARGVRVAVEAFQWTFARSSGAGGQSVNKTSTKATLTILLSDIQCSPTILARLEKLLPETVSVTSQVYRSQWRNRVACMELLCEKLNEASAPPPAPRRKTKPSRSAIERRLNSKRLDSEKKRNRRVTE